MRHAFTVAVLLARVFIVKGVPPGLPSKAGPEFAKAGVYAVSGGVFRYLQPAVMSLVASFFVLSGFLFSGGALRTRHVDEFLFIARSASSRRSSRRSCCPRCCSGCSDGRRVDVYFQDARFLRYLGNMLGFVAFELPASS